MCFGQNCQLNFLASHQGANAQYLRQVPIIPNISRVQIILQIAEPHANGTRAVPRTQIAAVNVSIRS